MKSNMAGRKEGPEEGRNKRGKESRIKCPKHVKREMVENAENGALKRAFERMALVSLWFHGFSEYHGFVLNMIAEIVDNARKGFCLTGWLW